MLAFAALLVSLHGALAFRQAPLLNAGPFLRTTGACTTSPRKNGAQTMTMIERRSLLFAAGGLALSGPAPVHAAPDSALVAKIKKGVEVLGSGGSLGPTPLPDWIIAVIDDGSAAAKAAFEGAKQAGVQVIKVPFSGDVKKAQDDYMAAGCLAAIVPDSKQLRERQLCLTTQQASTAESRTQPCSLQPTS